MSLLSPSSTGTHVSNFVWNPNEGNVLNDCKTLLLRLKEYEMQNRVLSIEQVGPNKVINYIRLIELMGRYGLYNLRIVDVPLYRFTPKAIYFCKNPRFTSYWFFDFLNAEKRVDVNDPNQMRRITTLLSVISPRGIEEIGLLNNSIVAKYHGQLYSLTQSVKTWEGTKLPSFSINTKQEGLLKFFLVDLGTTFSGHASKFKIKNIRSFVCNYYEKSFIYYSKYQHALQDLSLRNNSLYLVPNGISSDLISLSEINDYLGKYAFDDTPKGFGTRMFYYNEAEMIDEHLFPNAANSTKVLTQISNSEVAIHTTPVSFLRKTVQDCEDYTTMFVRVPRIFVIRQERLEQLITQKIITINSVVKFC